MMQGQAPLAGQGQGQPPQGQPPQGQPPQGQPPQGQPPQGQPPQGAPGQAAMGIEDTIANLLDENPEMTQQLHQALQEGDVQAAFDDMGPEETQEMMGLLQQIVENPQSYPQIYQQLMQSGGSPQDFPPPDSPPEEVEKVAGSILVVLYYMGKLGQKGGGGQSPQGQPPQGQGQPPPQAAPQGGAQGGIQGYPDGGIVGGQQLKQPMMAEYNADFSTQERDLLGPQSQMSDLGQLNASNMQMRMQDGGGGNQGVIANQGQSQGQLIDANNPDFARLRLTEQIRMNEAYGQSDQFRGYKNNPGRNIRGRYYKNDPGIQAQIKQDYETNPTAGMGWKDLYNNVPSINMQPARGTGVPDFRPQNGGPDTYWSTQGGGLGSLKSPGTGVTSQRGVDYSTNDPWQKEYGGAFEGAKFGPTYYGWVPGGQEGGAERMYPVRSQEQLDDYVTNKDYNSGMTPWDRKNTGGAFSYMKHRRQTNQRETLLHQNYADAQKPGYVPGTYPGISKKSKGGILGGFPDGGMIGAPAQPIQTNTGDDQMIAAKTGEGVLNIDAVSMLGGPNAVNQLNYQASGKVPGGQPVVQMGGMQGYNYGGVVSDTIPGAVAGYSHGGMVSDPQSQAITATGWVWSDSAQKYVEVSRNTEQFSGRTMRAMSFWGVFSKAIGIVVSIAAAIVAPYAAPLIGAAAGLSGAVASTFGGAVFGAISGAAAGAISSGSWKGALAGGVLGGLAGGVGGYLSFDPSTGLGATGAPGSFSAQSAANQNAGVFGNFNAGGAAGIGGGTGGFSPTDLGSAAAAGTEGFNQASILDNVSGIGAGSAVGGASGALQVTGQAPGSPGGVVGNTGAPGTGPNGGQSIGDRTKQVLGDIVGGITDPKTIAQAGLRTIGGLLGEEPRFGSDANQVGATNALGSQSALLNLQRQQYEKNVPGLQNQATGIARISASPQTTATQSSNAYRLQDDQKKRQLHDRLVQQGNGPGSPAYEAAMQKQTNASSLGGVNAYNTGYDRGVQTGTRNLATAKDMYDTPNYSQLAGQYAAVDQYGARVKESEWNARNESSKAAGDLFFPPNRDDELKRSQQTSYGMQV